MKHKIIVGIFVCFTVLTFGGLLFHWLLADTHQLETIDAEFKTLVAKGWIPEFVPADAYNIIEQHNLDTNQGVVEFSYRSTSWLENSRMRSVSADSKDKLATALKESAWEFRDEANNEYFESSEPVYSFLLGVNPAQRRAIYLMKPSHP